MSNYPPGVSGAPAGQGWYEAKCPVCDSVSRARGWEELGGFFLEEEDAPACVCIDEAVGVVWERVYTEAELDYERWLDKLYEQEQLERNT